MIEITINEMPLHNHPGSTTPMGAGALVNAAGANASVSLFGTPTAVTIAAQGGGVLNTHGVAMNIVQPTALTKKCIRYE